MSLYFCFYFANPFYFHVMIHITSKKLKKKKIAKLKNTYTFISAWWKKME